MDLLSPAQRAQFFAAIKDATDTFCQMPVTYELHGESMDAFNGDRDDEEFTSYNLLGLPVYADTPIDMKQYGAQDFAQGYVLFNWEDLQTAGLIGPKNLPIMDATRDYLTIQGVRWRTIATPALGILGEQPAVVKVFFKKEVIRQ